MTGRRASAFTLVEAVVTTVVLGILAGVTLPLINSVTDVYASSSAAARVVDDLGFALDRVVSVLREAPPGLDEGTIGIARADSSGVLLADGSGCRLDGDALLVGTVGGSEGPVAVGIDSFEIRYVASDGSDTAGAPERTQRFEVEISSGGMVLRTVAFCRSRYGT
jgi:type II secretory pathway pseudopilin PulG